MCPRLIVHGSSGATQTYRLPSRVQASTGEAEISMAALATMEVTEHMQPLVSSAREEWPGKCDSVPSRFRH